MTNNNLVSIIIPVYNIEKYMPNCIDSVLCQTYSNLQIILVDDGSTDGCGTICDAYAEKDSRIVVIHKENGGVSSARNMGLEYVKGTYVTFLDSDDAYAPCWIEKLVNAMESVDADVAVGNYRRVYENKETGAQSNHELGVVKINCPEDTIRYCFEKVLSPKHEWSVCSRLFRTGIIREKNIRFCETCENFAEDLSFTLCYSLFAECIVSIEAADYLYTVRENSMMQSSTGIAKLNCMNEVYFFCEPTLKQVIPEELQESILPIFHFLILYDQYRVLIDISVEPIKETVNAIQKYDQWELYTRKLYKNPKKLEYYFGKYNTKRILLWAHVCLHRSFFRYRIERKLFYLLNPEP